MSGSLPGTLALELPQGSYFLKVYFLLMPSPRLSRGCRGAPAPSPGGLQAWGWPRCLQRPALLYIRQHLAGRHPQRKGNCTAADLQLPTLLPQERDTRTGAGPNTSSWGSEHKHPEGACLDSGVPEAYSSFTHCTPKLQQRLPTSLQM